MTVRAAVVEAIVAHACAVQPAECCGVLLGTRDCVEVALAARNVSPEPTTRFIIDPKDHFDAIRDSRRLGLEIVGFYHSHPRSPAEPSETDFAEASYPDHLCLIVSLTSNPPEMRLFRLVSGNFQALPLVTVG